SSPHSRRRSPTRSSPTTSPASWKAPPRSRPPSSVPPSSNGCDAARWSSAVDDHHRAGGVPDQVLDPRPEMQTTGSSPDARAQHEQVGLELFYRSQDRKSTRLNSSHVKNSY